MATGGTYSGTVTVPTQKGQAYAANFDGLFVPAILVPDDGYQNERDYRHKAEVRDIGGNIMNKTYCGPFQRARGTLKILASNSTSVLALTPLDTLSMQQVNTNGTLGVAENWMIEEDTTVTFNREDNTVEVTVIKEPGISPE